MTSIHSAPRWARILPFSLLAATVLTTVATPAEAGVPRASFSQPSPIFLGDPSQGGFNTTDLTLPDGQASVYPSEIVITQASRITDVDVVLVGLKHTFPDDLEVVLVGPGGQQVVLMNDAGGSGDVDASLRFDDEAGAAISDGGPLTTSGVRPASHGALELTAPAPAPTGNTSLSVFDGTLANGTWKLFVYDDDPGSVGTLDGWDLTLETQTAPYPSEVSVSGIGSVTDLNVSIDDLTSTYPEDIDLLLVGPHGQQATLMSDLGGLSPVADVDLTLDDEAAANLSDTTLTSGTFRPTNLGTGIDVYPAPVPAPSGTTALSDFDGTDPNGVWKLYAADTVDGDFSEIGGWSLDIEWKETTGPTGSVSVNAGAATTKSTSVTLSLSATDPAPSTGVAQMRFSNDGTTYSAFQPYAATAAWSLAAGDGTKTVHAQFSDGLGNISTVSDTITLVAGVVTSDTTGPSATKLTPKKDARGVKAKVNVKVFASEALAPASVTKGSVVLKMGGSTRIKAKVTYDAATRVIRLDPRKRLRKGTYKVTVTTKVTDIVGNAWDQKPKTGTQPLTWTFKV